MEKYLYNLSEIPQAQQNLFLSINDSIKKALSNPGKVVRNQSGIYYVVITGRELVQIERLDEGPNKGQWIAREASLTGPKWYGDPVPTLKQLKNILGI